MKFHKHLCESVAIILEQIFVGNYYADKVIERHFKINKKWGKRDREFVASTVYEIVRWWRLYWHLLKSEPRFDKTSLISLVNIHFQRLGFETPEWLGQKFNQDYFGEAISKASFAIKQSIPDWISEELVSQDFKNAESVFEILNKQSPLIVRANTLKTNRADLLAKFKALDFEVKKHAQASEGIVFLRKVNVFALEEFKLGLFEVQDGHSQLIADYGKPMPGEHVIDACAGAGGKTLHLASLMKNKGKIIAMDVHEKKLQQLKLRLRRAGVDNTETRLIDSTKVIKRLEAKADLLLLDVPCSGLGVIRRNPDSKWKLNRERLRELELTQKNILQDYTAMVKPSGRVVYSTCSLFPSENELQVKNFLSSEAGKNFSLVREQTVQPNDEGADGFYMSLLQKTK